MSESQATPTTGAGAVIRGGCHCGRVAYEVRARLDKVLVCNCSICTMKAYLHWIVPREKFVLLRGQDELTTYTFNTGAAKHHFCRHCGVASFYIARSDPDKIDVNARCLQGVELANVPVETFDGRNWEAHYEVYKSRR